MNAQLSFLKLIEKFKVQIPILQRDYVQGRSTPTVEDIRSNFVNDLVEHIVIPTEKTLPLDFIYGYAEEEQGKYDREVTKNNIENILKTIQDFSSSNSFNVDFAIQDKKSIAKDLFIPLDGQQRLTTLFLLHFYVALKAAPEKLVLLKGKLTYKTRKSSQDFCEQLLDNVQQLDLKVEINEAIKDAKWFLVDWKKDPTVDGMLTMLQAIENKFNSLSDLAEKLKTAVSQLFIAPKIVFDFLDMNEQSISNEIYLKMNSTGKALSDYDNFKAWFVPKVAELINNNPSLKYFQCFEDWQNKLDQDWYNIFWSADPKAADERMFSFIKWILSFSEIIDETYDSKDNKIKENVEHSRSNKYTPLRSFEKLIISRNIHLLFHTLDCIAENKNSLLELIDSVWMETFSTGNNFKKELVTNSTNLSLLHQTFFYTTLLLIRQLDDKEEQNFKVLLKNWRNIIYNTRIDDFPRFVEAIRSLNRFFEKANNWTLKGHKIEFFDSEQVKEEHEKLDLRNTTQCDELFEKAENHHYLYGQIGFLIRWSNDENMTFQIDRFRELFFKFSILFSKENLQDECFIIQRTLLSFNDSWMQDKGSNRFSFCKSTYNSARERDENWRYVFKKEDSEILTLIEQSSCEREELDQIIENEKVNINNWRRFFLERPHLIAYCGEKLINRVSEGRFLRLLGKKKLSGYHQELRTWVLFEDLKNEFSLNEQQIKYQSVDSNGEDCRIALNNVYVKFDRAQLNFVYEEWSEECNQYYPLQKDNILDQNHQNFIANFDLKL